MPALTALLLLALTVTSSTTDAAKILGFFPMPTKSHQRFMQPLLKELAERGHQVSMYTPYLALQEHPANLEILKIPDYTLIMKRKMGMVEETKRETVFTGEDDFSTLVNILWFRQVGTDLSEWMFQQAAFKDLINSEREFDVVFLAASYFQEPFIVLGHRFNASVISFLPSANWLWAHYIHGNPYDTSYIVECMHAMTDTMSFRERLYLTASNMFLRLVYSAYFNPVAQRLLDKHVHYPGWQRRPPMTDMLSQTSLVLANSHVAVNYPYPFAPHFLEVGGLNIQPPRPLNGELAEFMEGAEHGVILFSLGSFVDVSTILGQETGLALSRLFSTLGQRVLWKWEKEIPGLPANVRISKWFPQQDILRHKNMALFITHGGLLSLTEAIDSGVPTVGIPLAADQMKNVLHMEHFGYGLRLKLTNLTAKSLSWAIHTILDNPKFAENAKKRSQLFRDKPETALETAVFWTEYVIRHKGAHHLRPAIATMPWYQQAMIDVYAAIAAVITLLVYTFYKSLKVLFNLCNSNTRHKNKQD